MITIKLKYKSTKEFQDFLFKLRKQFSCVYRYSYNRLFDGLSKKEIYKLIPTLNNVELIKGRLINDCIDFSNNLYEKDKKLNHKSIFGGRKSFILRCKGNLTKEQLSQKRLTSLYSQGEVSYKGNRFFNLDFINNKITYKYNRENHFDLNLKISKNQLKQLIELQDLCELKKSKYTVTLNENYICISFEPIKHEVINLIKTRFVGIDLNPTNIGMTVCDDKMNIVNAQCFDFTEIIDKINSIKKSSDSKELKHLNNKLNYEILNISKRISDISKHYKCKFVFIEDLVFKKSDKGKQFNRLTKNLWKRNVFIENLNKRCEINNQKLYKVNPAYSSIIGNCMYDYVDSVNASLEIARRGYECIINKSKKFYPVFWLKKSLKHQWKEMNFDLLNDWKELFVFIKNSKVSYRVSLNDAKSFNVFRNKPRKYNIYQFI